MIRLNGAFFVSFLHATFVMYANQNCVSLLQLCTLFNGRHTSPLPVLSVHCGNIAYSVAYSLSLDICLLFTHLRVFVYRNRHYSNAWTLNIFRIRCISAIKQWQTAKPIESSQITTTNQREWVNERAKRLSCPLEEIWPLFRSNQFIIWFCILSCRLWCCLRMWNVRPVEHPYLQKVKRYEQWGQEFCTKICLIQGRRWGKRSEHCWLIEYWGETSSAFHSWPANLYCIEIDYGYWPATFVLYWCRRKRSKIGKHCKWG